MCFSNKEFWPTVSICYHIASELSTVIKILKISCKRFFEYEGRVEIIRLVTKMKELHNMMTWLTDTMQGSDSKLPIMYTLYILLWLSLFTVLQVKFSALLLYVC